MIKLVKNNLLNIIFKHLWVYPTPININYLWSFGSLSGLCLTIQLVTGILLVMHYVPNADLAFISVEHIMRNVNNGWILRYLHANGASVFFIFVYLHIFRGLYFHSYTNPRTHLWLSGLGIFLLMMAIAFMGYVLPWGQMSFWGVTVITNMFSAIPLVGHSIVEWLWGGFSVNNATLNRFFSLHYLLPFILTALVIVHLYLLHENGSTNPSGINTYSNNIRFYPYLYVKDLLAFFGMLFLFGLLVFFFPNSLGHPDNYIPANPLVTPPHIVPEWYFLPFYAILRSIPNKLGGVIAMFAAIVSLALLIFLYKQYYKSNNFNYILSIVFYLFFFIFLILGWIGANPAEDPYIGIGMINTLLYFSYFFIIFVLNLI